MAGRSNRVSGDLRARRGGSALDRFNNRAAGKLKTGAASRALRAATARLELLEPRLCLSAETVPFFQPAANIPVGGAPTAIVTDDFNGDGNDDLAVALGQSNAVGVALGNGDGTFGAFTDYSTGADPTAIATGDFNNDGNDDIVTADAGSGDISVLLCNDDSNGNPLGTFAAPIDTHVEAPGNGPMSLAVGDFNNDGNLEVAIAGPHGLYVLLGNGDGTFSAPQLLSSGDFSGVVADSFFPDGNTDLAAVDPVNGVVDVFQGNGDGTFDAPVPYSVDVGASSITSGAFTSDGAEDIAVTVPGQNAVEVLLGNTMTVTDPSPIITPTPITPTPITPTPVTPPILQPGGPVIPVATPVAAAGTTNLTTMTSPPASGGTSGSGDGDDSYSYTTGSGTFAAPITIHLDQTPTSLTLDDLSGDGNYDIITANTADNSITVVPGNGDGTFGTPVDLATGNAPASVTTDDVNNDGGDDILTANAGGVSVLLQQSSDVGVALTTSPTATINTNLTYTVTVTNSGPGTATGVTLDDTLPGNVTLVSAASSQGSVDTSSTTDVDASFGDLANGASATVTIIVQPTQYGIASDSVSVSSISNDPNYANNYASTNTPVVGATGAEVALTSTSGGAFLPPVPILPVASGVASATPVASTTAVLPPADYGGYFAEVGQDYTYSFTVTNYGPDAATGLTFTDTLPAGVTFESATASAGTTDSATPGTVTAALGDLAAGASDTVSITIVPTAAGSITDSASVAAADPSTNPYPQGASTTVDTYVEGKGGIVPYPVLEDAPVSTTLAGVAGSNGTAAKPVKTVTVGLPTLSISNVKQTDTTKGTTDFVFTVTRAGNLTSASSVSYSTSGGTAKAGTDFQPASGQLSFAAGASTANVTVPVMGSKKYKPASTFVVALAHPTDATVKTSHAVGTILSAVKAPKTPKPKPTPNPAAKGININFEPAGGPTIRGYLEDTGLEYGTQGTLTYGWSTDNTANAVDRNIVKDARYDTFNVLGAPGVADWQISLPDGRYRLSLVAGDPTNTTNSYEVDANGSVVLNGKAKKKRPFVSASATISVTGGLLTLTPGSSASPDDLDFLDIKYVGALKA